MNITNIINVGQRKLQLVRRLRNREVRFTDFNIGDKVIVCNNYYRWPEVFAGEIIFRWDEVGYYKYRINGFGLIVDPTMMNIQKYDEKVYTELQQCIFQILHSHDDNLQNELNKLNQLIKGSLDCSEIENIKEKTQKKS